MLVRLWAAVVLEATLEWLHYRVACTLELELGAGRSKDLALGVLVPNQGLGSMMVSVTRHIAPAWRFETGNQTSLN